MKLNTINLNGDKLYYMINIKYLTAKQIIINLYSYTNKSGVFCGFPMLSSRLSIHMQVTTMSKMVMHLVSKHLYSSSITSNLAFFCYYYKVQKHLSYM